MNLILLFDDDFISSSKVRLSGRSFEHVKGVLKLAQDDEVIVGKLNGLMGKGTIDRISDDSLEMRVILDKKPPQALNVTLIMALARPQMLKRTLQAVAALGVKKIVILNFAKVDKSLWQSSALRPEAIRHELMLGLEQAKDTILPEVILRKQFKPFVEDELPALIKGRDAFVAHPGEERELSSISRQGIVLIIGPEGGITDFEIALLKEKGVKAVSLGERILRFEHVIPYVLGKVSA